MTKNLELGQLVLCTVTKIEGTTVFAKIDDYNIDGTLTFMEIAPGRIRNIREYAFPGKKIVCKVLSIKPNHIELSFRRVKINERNEFNERQKKERNYSAMLKTILGVEKSEETIKKIREAGESFLDLIESAKEKPEVLSKFMDKESSEKILGILKEKKVKEIVVSKKFSLSSKLSNGIPVIKKIISDSLKESGVSQEIPEVSYIAAGKYRIKLKSKDPKSADQSMRKILSSIENLAKKGSCIFEEEKD